MMAIQILLPHLDAKRTGLAILHLLQAWATATYLDRIESETWQPRSIADLADTPPPDFLEEPSACGERVLEGPGRTTDPATGEVLALSNVEGTGNGDPATPSSVSATAWTTYGMPTITAAVRATWSSSAAPAPSSSVPSLPPAS